jgi:N-acetylmuramoyl-L-alanine amidase
MRFILGSGVDVSVAFVILRLLALGLGLLLSARAEAAPEVTAVRVGVESDATRLVLQLSEPVSYNLFTLTGPDRVVVDLPQMTWRATEEIDPRGLVARLRVGLFKPGTSRLVLDLNGPARVQQAMLLPGGLGPRLVVDLEPAAGGLARPMLARVQPAAASVPFTAPGAAIARQAVKPVIAIDAGHGGADPGAIGVHGTYEKHVTLAAARELKAQLEATGRYKVVLTRRSDVFIRLRDRVMRARKAGADLFISLHADSIGSPDIRGLSVYTLSERASDKEAAALAVRENKADLIAGVDLSGVEAPEVVNILIDLAQRETMNLSARYASMLVDDLGDRVALLRDTHRFAGFAVLKAPDVPSVLIELGYLSNPTEERMLADRDYRARLIGAIVRATERFFSYKDSLSRS